MHSILRKKCKISLRERERERERENPYFALSSLNLVESIEHETLNMKFGTDAVDHAVATCMHACTLQAKINTERVPVSDEKLTPEPP